MDKPEYMVSFGYTVFLAHFDNRRQRTCFFHLRRRICRRVALLSVSRSVAAAAWAAASAVSRRQPTSRRLMRACPVAVAAAAAVAMPAIYASY